MAFTIPDDVLGTISKLSNYPNRIERMKAAALKARFDADAKTVMAALKRLIRELAMPTAAKNVGFEKTTAVNADNVQDAIENVQSQIAGVSQSGIADASVTASKIADGAVGTAAIADDAITADKLAMSAVDTDAIKLGAVDTHRLKNAAVEESKIASGAVTRGKIDYDAVEGHNIVDNAVTGDKIAYYTIGSRNIGERAIMTSALVDKAVTTEKIATGAVTSEKIKNGAIQKRHFTSGALQEDIPADKLTFSATSTACTLSTHWCKFAVALKAVFFGARFSNLSDADVERKRVYITASGTGGYAFTTYGCYSAYVTYKSAGTTKYVSAPAFTTQLASNERALCVVLPDDVTKDTAGIFVHGLYFVS